MPRKLPAAVATLNVRGINPSVAKRIKAGASVRGWTIAGYLGALVALHDATRHLAEQHPALRAELGKLGLETRSA